MAKCGCAGGQCGCLIVSGAGIAVTGTGTAVDPFTVTRDTSTDSIGAQFQVTDTTTVNLTKLGTGTALDPVVLEADVRITAPNGTIYTIAVNNSGVLSAVAV